ncbi:VOC family protein [Ideonella azotifigens]|uniref:VOC family protein n=1 Tax=Ideonella azotifigens TaxID=513160 RepID=A0ABN1JQE1_9BURK|nr:VOC family protein [Ideonella azotifigens]MCD2340089.1 VOC family protein [Ideonella azotifigens]
MPQQFHVGRLIDHLHLRVADLDASKRFYRAVFTALGRAEAMQEDPTHFALDELWVDQRDPGGPVSHVHLAFQAADPAMVQAFHQAALAAGGTDHGGPGERHYHPGYYAAFVLDPDGNNIEAVFHGPNVRSAPSVVVSAVVP